MNILVTGAAGQLGRSLRAIAPSGPNRYIFTDVCELDITDREAVDAAIHREAIDIVVNCAAYTNVDKAESDFDTAELLNAIAVKHLADAVKSRGGWLIHISTDYVFGGSAGNTPRTETEPVNPTGVYGLTKLHGEEKIKESGCKAIIIRTSWLYSEYGKNFVKTMLELTGSRPELKVVFDQVGTPTYAHDLASLIIDIIESNQLEGKEGIYHFSNEGVCSWFDFTKEIAELSGHTQCKVSPCHSDEFPSPVVRPPYSVLDKTKVKETFGREISYWKDSLRICISNLK